MSITEPLPTSVDKVRAMLDDTLQFCAHAITFSNALVALGLQDTPRVVIAYTQHAADLAKMLEMTRAWDKPAHEYADLVRLCATLKREIKEQIEHDIYCAVGFIDMQDSGWVDE